MKRCKSCKKQVNGSHYCATERRNIAHDDTSFIVSQALFNSTYSDSSSSSCDTSSSSSSDSCGSSSFDGGSSGGFDGGGSSGSF